MPRDVAGHHIAKQVMRSGTSPAANYCEAREAVSDRDYLFKMQICLKELRETEGWIEMARAAGFRNADYAAAQKECGELIAIMITCVRKVKARLERNSDGEKDKGKGND